MDNYNSRFPTISFRIDNMIKKKLEKEADKKQISATALAQEIIRNFFIDSSAKNKEDLDNELLKARLEKIKVETKYLQLKNDYFENFKKPLSDSGTRMLSRAYNHQKIVSPENNQSPYDESNKRFQCVDCGVLFAYGSMDGFLSQMLEYKNHIVAQHNRELNAIEKDVFNKIQFQGVSK